VALTRDPGHVLILGAGPTGLGAAHRFQQLGFANFHVLEAATSAGGLASSVVDEQGFTWDLGGHVQFSHYSHYDAVLEAALGDEWLWHERESWVWIKGRFVPYPFQNNIHRLDPEDMELALRGLERAAAARPVTAAAHFGDWIHTTFGDGIARLFLYPYNAKVWGVPPERMGTTWMGERVAVPDLARIRRNIAEGRDDVSWGPNHRFRFPRRGGTGAIWRRVAELIAPARLLFGHRVARVNAAGRAVTLADGRTMRYDSLITSAPLDLFTRSCEGLAADARRAAAALVHSSVHIVGVGLKGPMPAELSRKCWMYYPEDHNPYYRVTVFSNYSPANVPDAASHYSLMAEVCESPYRPVDESSLRDWVLAAMRKDGLIGSDADLVSYWHRRLEHGYPTPFLGRDEALGHLIGALAERRIYSRGRFGGWKYEVANQDHSFMQGVELADRLLSGAPETTYFDPARANSGVFLSA
jgi:protoporphyrinogen oxidase